MKFLYEFVRWLMAKLDYFAKKLNKIWKEEGLPLLEVLVACTWSVLVLLIGGALMLISGQGAEIAYRTGDNVVFAVAALAGLLLYAVHTWFDARRVLDFLRFDTNTHVWAKRLPRLLGSGVAVVGTVAFGRAWLNTHSIWLLVLTFSSLVLVFVLYNLAAKRRKWKETRDKLQQSKGGKLIAGLQFESMDWLASRLNPITLFYSAFLFLIVTVAPVSYGFTIGSVGVVFLALSSIVWAGSWLSLKMAGAPQNQLIMGPAWVRWAAAVMLLVALGWDRPLVLAAVFVVLLALWKFGDKPWMRKLMVLLQALSNFSKGLWRGLIWLLIKLKALPTLQTQTNTGPATAKVTYFPVLTGLVILALVFSSTGLNDNHAFPVQTDVAKRPDVSTYNGIWFDQAPVSPDGKKPMIIIATAGGGIRAGYWTASVLGGITDAHPRFRDSLYAISSVSGGSVGAAVYASSLQAAGQACASADQEHCLRGKMLQALSGEFLAPTVARMLYSDLAQRFLPIALLPDRAGALEESWQAKWKSVDGFVGDGMAASVSHLVGVSDQGWQPALLLNSTHVEAGKRVIASSIELGSAPDQFLDAVDLITLMNKDIRLGTAALNSARFTYVSPPGTLPCKGLPFIGQCNGHVVDGGYYENFGAVTALQVLKAAKAEWKEGEFEKTVRPIVILISNDVNLVRGKDGKVHRVIENDKQPKSLPNDWFAMESLGPVKALLDTRDARGIQAAKELWRAVDESDRYHFSMDLGPGDIEPALGWVLARNSEKLMCKLLTKYHHNRGELERLLKTLGAPAEKIKQATNPKLSGCK